MDTHFSNLFPVDDTQQFEILERSSSLIAHGPSALQVGSLSRSVQSNLSGSEDVLPLTSSVMAKDAGKKERKFWDFLKPNTYHTSSKVRTIQSLKNIGGL